MSTSFNDLYEFIERAVKNRKYPPTTAKGYRVALKLFEDELNEEEKASLELVKKNLDQIQQQVYNKNKQISAGSLATYKSRLSRVVSDYEKYGTDATKMANWSPKVVVRSKKTIDRQPVENAANSSGDMNEADDLAVDTSGMHKIQLALRPGAPVTLILPQDLQPHEVATITAILNSLTMNVRADNEKQETTS